MPKKFVVRKSAGATTDGLQSYVPKMELFDRYVQRKINGVVDFEVFEWAMENSVNVLLQGPTGSGKTIGIMAYAAANQLPFYDVPCDISMTPQDLFGRMVPNEEGGFEWRDGPVTTIFRNGGVLLVSEVNLMSPKIAGSLYPLFDARRHIVLLGNGGEVVEAHPSLLLVADMNPRYHGTQELNAAFKNRFGIIATLGYDDNVEEKLVTVPEILSVARSIRSMPAAVRTPVSTNMLLEFITLASKFGYKFAETNFVEKFAPAEQGAVTNVLDAASAKIERELIQLSGPKSDTEVAETIDPYTGRADEEDEDEEELPFDDEDENSDEWVVKSAY